MKQMASVEEKNRISILHKLFLKILQIKGALKFIGARLLSPLDKTEPERDPRPSTNTNASQNPDRNGDPIRGAVSSPRIAAGRYSSTRDPSAGIHAACRASSPRIMPSHG
jgi:hypothetical protein